MSDKNVDLEKALKLIAQYEEDIQSYELQKSRLGFLQGKRKKEIDKAIQELNNKIIGLKLSNHIK